MKNLNELLADARQYADLTGHGALYLAPGVSTAEAHVAAWHAIAVQGGHSSPQREAWRLAADKDENVRRNTLPEFTETSVDTELVAKAIGAHEFAQGTLSRAPVSEAVAAPPALQPPTNERGEYTGTDGKLYHETPVTHPTYGEGFAQHEGEWLKCDTCNPLKVLRATPDTELAELRARYADLKRIKDAATEEFDAVKSKLQHQLSEATNGATRAVLYVDGHKPMNLTYSEPWTVDSKRLQAEQPLIYVQYARQGKRWTMAESRSS